MTFLRTKCSVTVTQSKERNMKGMDRKKESKKKPSKTPEEKRAAKREKGR